MIFTDKLKGTLALVLSTVFYGLIGVYSRLIGIDFGIFTQGWTRNLVVLIIILIPLITIKKLSKIRKQDLLWLLFWGLNGIIASTSFFIAANFLSLSTTIILFYAGSNISGYLSGMLFFREKVNLLKIIAIILSLAGIGVIYSFNLELKQTGYLVIAFLSGTTTGLWNTLSKKFSGNYTKLQLIFLDSLMTFIFALAFGLILQEKIPVPALNLSWIALLLFAINQILTVSLTIYGFKYLEAQIGSLIMPLEVFWATLFGFIFFQEGLTINTFLGGILIIISIILTNVKWKKQTEILDS